MSEEMTRRLSRSITGWVALWFLVLAAGLVAGGWWYFESLRAGAVMDEQPVLKTLWDARLVLGAILAGSVLVTGILLRVCIGGTVGRHVAEWRPVAPAGGKRVRTERPPEAPARSEAAAESRETAERRALQVVAILQREGRLVDFLSEDLSAYEDAQIGAAVRSIQESCRKVLQKHLAFAPVMDQEEGEQVTVQAGFDAGSIKLTGNVTGDPPFSGVLQHRGWRATRVDLPTLSGTQDPKLIAPAEVEVQ